MAKLNGNAQPQVFELGKILGFTTEMVATFISASHVVLAEEKRLTFLRFMMFIRAFVKLQPAKLLRLWLNTFHPPAAPWRNPKHELRTAFRLR
jgi:hypothetical protein